jgi:hypothetical protein
MSDGSYASAVRLNRSTSSNSASENCVQVTATYYYTRRGSHEKIPARSDAQADAYADIYGGEMSVELTSPILFESEEGMSNLAKYFQWLQVIITLKDDAAEILAALQVLMAAIGKVVSKFPALPAPSVGGGLSFTAPEFVCETVASIDGTLIPAEVLDAESKVLALMAPTNAATFGDGSRLRGLFDWLQSSGLGKTLFDLLVGIVLKKAAGV